MKTIKLQTKLAFPNISESKNYKRISNGDVLTGNQVLYLLEIAKPIMQAMILLDIWPTEETSNKNF